MERESLVNSKNSQEERNKEREKKKKEYFDPFPLFNKINKLKFV